MGDIRLSIGQVNIVNYLIINVREVGNPNVIVQSQVKPPPVPSSFNLLFAGLADVVHYVDFRSSNDGISLGLLLGTFVYDVKNEVVISEKRFYTVDGLGTYDPTSSDSSITDPYLDGKIVSTVYKEGYRPLEPAVEFEHVGDTINFLAPNLQTFGSEEKMVVEIVYKAAASSAGAAFPVDIITITTDTSLVTIHQNKLMEINGSATNVTLTMPSFASIPEGTKYAFSTDLGSQRNAIIVIDPGAVNYAWVDGVQRSTLYMGRGEYMVLIKKGAYMRVLEWRGDYSRVGELVYKDVPPINGVAQQGAWEDIDDYQRLYYWFVNELDPSYLGIGTYPTAPSGVNRHKWCIDIVNNKLWFPDFGGLFLRSTDADGSIDADRSAGDRKPGTYQDDQIKSHNHVAAPWDKASARAGDVGGSDTTGSTDGNGLSTEYRIASMSVSFWNLATILPFGGSETRPKNVNMNIYRII